MKTLGPKICTFLLIACLIIVCGCSSRGINVKAIDKSEIEFNKNQKKERAVYMTLETMFSDHHVRDLAKAAAHGKLKVIEELINKGVHVNTSGKNRATPLFWAFRNNNLRGFTKLLELGADPNILFDNSSVMHYAARHEDKGFLEAALKYGGNPNLRAGPLGETPLFKTINFRGDRSDSMLTLLRKGADIDAMTGRKLLEVDQHKIFSFGGDTPVIQAARLARFDIVYQLLELGADYSLKNYNGDDITTWIDKYNGRFYLGSKEQNDFHKVVNFIKENK